jgi:hypothetical protein
MPSGQKFVLRDLGERHIFVTKKGEDIIKGKMEDLINENTFETATLKRSVLFRSSG